MILQVSNVKKWKKETGRIEKVNKKSQKGKRVIPTQNPDEVPKEKLKVSSSQAPRKKRHLNRIPGAKDMGSQSLKEKSNRQTGPPKTRTGPMYTNPENCEPKANRRRQKLKEPIRPRTGPPEK